MKNLLWALIAVVAAVVISACEDEKSNSLVFDNASNYTVQVIPLTTEWGSFSLPPGEKKKLGDVRDADFRFEPDSKVQEGGSSTERYIIFVDAPPAD